MVVCYIVTVEDGADFQALMARRVFLRDMDAATWGREKVQELQDKRRAEGETDRAFINAIEYHVTVADLDRRI